MYYQVTIPIRSYLKKMIKHHKEVDPFEVTIGRDHYSGIFFNAFSQGHIPRDYKLDIKNDDGYDQIDIFFNKKLARTNRFFLDNARFKYIDQQLIDCFNEKLFSFLDVSSEFNTKANGIKANVSRFMHVYGIDESEIKQESLIKKYQRYRFSKKEKDGRNFHQKRDKDKEMITSNLTHNCK